MQPQFPPAPWKLTGRAALLLASWRELRLLVAYESSPVGPYLEHAIVACSRRGPSVTQMSVTSPLSIRGGIANWGYPKVLENLHHRTDGDYFWFSRDAGHRRRQVFRLRCFGPSFPVALQFFSMQSLQDKTVQVPGRIRGRAKLAFQGRQLALVLQNFDLTIDPPIFFD